MMVFFSVGVILLELIMLKVLLCQVKILLLVFSMVIELWVCLLKSVEVLGRVV